MHRILALLLLASCGGHEAAPTSDAARADAPRLDAPAVDAAATGSATITGSVAEQTFEPTTAYLVRHPSAGYQILAMNEGGPTCNAGFPPGLSAVVGFPCGAVEARSYVVKDFRAPCEPGAPHVAILAEHFSGELSEYDATAGGATITAIAPELAGTFVADFGEKGHLEGTFSAVVCP